MKTETVIAIVFLAISLATSGCATVVNGRTQKIGVGSTPSGATVLIDNHQQLITPAAIELARDQSHTFHFKKEGYQDDSFVITSDTSGWVWGNVLLGGLVGGVVDFATGAARKLSHDSVHVTLAPLPAMQTAFPAVLSTVATEQSSPPGSSREAQLLELKSLLDKGLITQEEYEEKRTAILNRL